MGICASSHATTKADDHHHRPPPPSAKVVDVEGRLKEFRRRVTAEEVLSGHPNCYVCSADNMLINTNAPQLPKDEVLQLGQIYFLMPLSKSLTPLSLEDLCDLAIKTSKVLDSGCGPFPDDCRKFRFSDDGNYRNNNNNINVTS